MVIKNIVKEKLILFRTELLLLQENGTCWATDKSFTSQVLLWY